MIPNKRLIMLIIVHIDKKVKQQLHIIIEDIKFQKIVSLYSGLKYLINLSQSSDVIVKLLNIKDSMLQDFAIIDEPYNTKLGKIIIDEYEIPGNFPIGALYIGSYFDITSKKDVNILQNFSEIAAYCFCPILTSISARSFGIDHYHEMTKVNFHELFRTNKMLDWSKFCQSFTAKFLSIAVPEISVESILQQKKKVRGSQLSFNSLCSSNIWVNGALGVLATIINCYKQNKWFLGIVGINLQDLNTLGAIQNTSKSYFLQGEYKKELFLKRCSTNLAISENFANYLNKYGLIPISNLKNQNIPVIYTACTVSNLNIEKTSEKNYIANNLPYILCISKFAHYIKAIGRNKLGSFTNIDELENYLNKWLLQYIDQNTEASIELKQRYPLYSARCKIEYNSICSYGLKCALFLRPHSVASTPYTEMVLKLSI